MRALLPNHANNDITALLVVQCSSLSTLDSGSGRKVHMICNGTGVWHGIYFLHLNLDNGQMPGSSFILRVA